LSTDSHTTDGPKFPTACPLCGGSVREVCLETPRGNPLRIKVRVSGKVFAQVSNVTAIACADCGYILPFVDRPEIIKDLPPI
jgi:DNA-directed RNA polymerase subunit RPC12/RpoP